MKVVSPGFEILPERENILKQIEERGRLCYKSEDKIEGNSHIKFFDKIKSNNHGSVMEMAVIHTKIWGETDCLHKLFDKLSRNKYIKSSLIGEYLLVSGSVRALTEFFVQRLVELAKLDYAIYNESETLNEFINKVINDSSTYNQVTGYHTYLANLDYSCIRLLSLDKFDKDIVNKHKYVAVKFTVNRAVSHELVRHRVSSLLQECLSGDTVVRSFNGSKSWSMKELYRIFTDKRCGRARSAIRIRVKDDEGEIVPSKILNVFKSGEKELFLVTTKNGRSIKSSANHIYFTEHGQKRLKAIIVGDKLWMNGKTIEYSWLREEYLIKNRQRKAIATDIGMSDAWLGKKIREFGLQKPKALYPGRKPGHGVKGMHSEKGKMEISNRMSGSKNHRWLGENITEGGARGRLHRRDNAKNHFCVCGKVAEEMHHIDRNALNNDISNIEHCCTKCHKARHKQRATIAWLDEIVSIEPCGKEETYDLEVEHPSHNFIANGFVVHNSQRYCRYSDDKFGNEVTFIKPIFFKEDSLEYRIWENSMKESEDDYLELLKTTSPQAARTVLPNSCKTEIILYTNLDHWKFIFGLRTSQAAEPSMREVMITLQEEFKRLGYV